jgi:hypothetical protein
MGVVVIALADPLPDEVAGDSFDYALNADHLDVAVIDSVGHDLHSSLISHVVQGSLRNGRRNGADLVGAYAEADEALVRVFADGHFRWVSAGHPPPLLVCGLIPPPRWCGGGDGGPRAQCPRAERRHDVAVRPLHRALVHRRRRPGAVTTG